MNEGLGLSLYMGLIMSGYKDYYLSNDMKVTDYGKQFRVIILTNRTYVYIDCKNASYSTDGDRVKVWTLINSDTLGYLKTLSIE